MEEIRRGFGTGCCVMMLVSAGTALAKVIDFPRVDEWAVSGNERAGTPGGARLFGETSRAPEPWFRRTFIAAGTDGTWAVKPVEQAVPKPRPVKSEAAPADNQPPGVVQNLRRTDRR